MKRHTIRLPFSTKPHWIAGAPAIFLFGMAWALLEIGLAAGFKGQHESLLSAITLTIIGFGVYEALKTMLWIHACFFKSNEGLRRRFPWKYTIDEYQPDELKNIFLFSSVSV